MFAPPRSSFYTQCYIRARGTRRLVILPDGQEPISSLPFFLRSLQFARSAEEVLARLGGGGAVPEPKVPTHSRAEPPLSIHPVSEPAVAAPADPQAGTAIDGPIGMRMRFVPAGSYTIGSPEGEPGRDADETLHQVQLTRGFWLGETPVTQAQWKQLVPGPKQPSHFKSGVEDLPLESVNWFEAVEFANRLSDKEVLPRCYKLINPKGTLGGGNFFNCDEVTFAGLDCPGYRLPTDSEWEVAARAGGDPAKGAPPDLNAVAWYQANSDGRTHSVGLKTPNSWGFHDLLGNVWEWTGNGHSLSSPVRGGSWNSRAQSIRAAYRSPVDRSNRWDILGFRLARSQS